MKTAPTPLRRAAAALLLAAAALPLAPLAAQDAAADPPAEAQAEPAAEVPVTLDTAPPAPETPAAEEPAAAAPAPAAAAPTRRTTTRTTTTTRAAPRAPAAAPAPVPAIAAAPPAAALPADPGAATAAPLPADALPPAEVLPDTGGGTDIANVSTTAGDEEGGTSPLLWLLAGLLVAGVIAALLLRRRRRGADEIYHEETAYDPPAPAPAPPVMREPEPAPVMAAPVMAAPAIPAAPMHDSSLDEPAIAATGAQIRAQPAAATAAADPGFIVSSLGLGGAALGAGTLAAAAATGQPSPAEAPAAATATETGRPWLDLFMRPVRAGVSGGNAVVEFELAVTNQGSAAARHVRVSTWMLAAGPGQESEMERMLVERGQYESASDLPEITIDPGAAQKIETSVNLAMGQAHGDAVLPVVVAEARYRLPDGTEGRTSASFAVGVPDGEELAHFAIHNPSGLHEGVEARALGEPERA